MSKFSKTTNLFEILISYCSLFVHNWGSSHWISPHQNFSQGYMKHKFKKCVEMNFSRAKKLPLLQEWLMRDKSVPQALMNCQHWTVMLHLVLLDWHRLACLQMKTTVKVNTLDYTICYHHVVTYCSQIEEMINCVFGIVCASFAANKTKFLGFYTCSYLGYTTLSHNYMA